MNNPMPLAFTQGPSIPISNAAIVDRGVPIRCDTAASGGEIRWSLLSAPPSSGLRLEATQIAEDGTLFTPDVAGIYQVVLELRGVNADVQLFRQAFWVPDSLAASVGGSTTLAAKAASGASRLEEDCCVTMSDADPENVGLVADPGVSADASRADHVHAIEFETVNAVLATADAPISVNGQRITDVAMPVADNDAISFYALADNLYKQPAKYAASAVAMTNVALSGVPAPELVDDVSLVVNDYVLLTAQADPLENGVWRVLSGAWTRAPEWEGDRVHAGSSLFIQKGTIYADHGFVMTTNGHPTVGTDALYFHCYTKNAMPNDWFNVRDYGAVGDGVTDDLAAFHYAIRVAMGPKYTREYLQESKGATLFVPRGNYYLSDNLIIDRCMVLEGVGGTFLETGSILKFAPYKGIKVQSAANSATGGDGTGAVIRQLRLQGPHLPNTEACWWQHAKWEANHEYEVGDKVMMAHVRNRGMDPLVLNTFEASTEWYYECLKAGTSGVTEPIWWQRSATEGVGDWASDITAWAPGVYTSMASQVLASGRYDVFFSPDLDATIAHAPRRTGAIEPAAFATAMPTDPNPVLEAGPDGDIAWRCHYAAEYLKADNMDLFTPLATGCVWVPRNASGVDAKTRVTIEDCIIHSFLTAGITVQCSSSMVPGSAANGFKVKDVSLYFNGGGIVARGLDANVGVATGLDICGSWDYLSGWARDLCNAEWSATCGGECTGACAGSPDPVACQDECVAACMAEHVPPCIAARYIAYTYTNEFGINDASALGCLWMGHQIAQVQGPSYICLGQVASSTNIGQYVEGDSGRSRVAGVYTAAFGGNLWIEQTPSLGGVGHIGYHDWRNVAATIRTPSAITSPDPDQPFFRRSVAHLGDQGFGSFGLECPSTFDDNGDGDSYAMQYGMFGDGTWAMALQGNPNRVPYYLTDNHELSGMNASIAFPKGYQLGREQVSFYVFPDDYGKLDSGIRFGNRVVGDRSLLRGDKVGAGKFVEEVCTEPGMNAVAWAQDTPYNAFPAYGPGSWMPTLVEAGGHVYRCALTGVADSTEPTWPTTVTPYASQMQGRYKGMHTTTIPKQCYRVGSVVAPRVSNGYIYQVSAAPLMPNGEYYGFTDELNEPAWPTTISATVADGQLEWTCLAADDPAAWVTDGTTEWVCVGPTAVWSRTNWVHNYGNAKTLFGGAPTHTIDMGVLDNDAISVWEVKVKAVGPNTAPDCAAFKLSAAWYNYYGAITAVLAPTATTVAATAGAAGWSATLQVNTGTQRVEVVVTGDPLASDIRWECIRDVW